MNKVLKISDVPDIRNWYVLWAPAGFGGTTGRVAEIQSILRGLDPDAIAWYPLRPEVIDGKTYMKALYAGYMFICCKWSPGMEDALVERLPVFAVFLKHVETLAPLSVPEWDIDRVKQVVEEVTKVPEKYVQVKGFKPGDSVKILKRSFFGLIGQIHSFDIKSRVVVDIPMFSRVVPVTFELRDLEAL